MITSKDIKMVQHERLAFTLGEYRRRYDAVVRAMDAKDIDVLLVRTPENIAYLTGYVTPGYYGYHCLILSRDQAPTLVVRFLVDVGKPFQAVITINEYLSIATKLILALGLCFETPILVFFLARMGIVTERWLLAKFKYAVLVIFIVSAVITPSADIATQCVFAVPMILLYLIGVLAAWIFRRRDATAPAAESA